jgi:hypothetical protein
MTDHATPIDSGDTPELLRLAAWDYGSCVPIAPWCCLDARTR